MDDWKTRNRERVLEYSRNYEATHKPQRKIKNKRYKTANAEAMAEYQRQYRKSNREKDVEMKRNYYVRNAEHLREYARNYRQRHSKRFELLRQHALVIVGRGSVRCIKCGCDDPTLIEINHINGGGKAERRLLSSQAIHTRIIDGRRSIDDLDLRCRVCNLLHYLEMKYGISNYDVTWRGTMRGA